MSDRELLEMAAKAAGYPIHSDAWAMRASGGQPSLYIGNNGPIWNPLVDDGDALRLAVQLQIKVRWHKALNQALVWPLLGKEIKVNCEEVEGDQFAATRRAIVLAAAERGSRMP